MHIDRLKTRYSLDYDMLPHQGGLPNVVQIHSIDTVEYMGQDNGRPAMKTKHNLWLVGCKLPLVLNNTRLDVIGSMLGEETDLWQGRRIALQTGATATFGKTKMAILVIPQLPQPDAPLVQWPSRYSTIGMAPVGPALPPPRPLAPQPPPAGAPAQQGDPKAPIGVQLAIDLFSAAATRGKDGAWIVSTLGILGLNVSDKLPPEYPHLALSLLSPALRQLPKVGAPPTAQVQAGWRASWSPPAAASEPNEVVDPITGEVTAVTPTPARAAVPAGTAAAPAADDPDDDIPF